MLVGIQGSGKTRAAKCIHECLIRTGRDCEIIGADLHIEAEAKCQGRTYQDVWSPSVYPQAECQAHRDARRLAKSLSSVIWDATNITAHIRKKRIDPFRNSPHVRVAVCLPTSLERALENNRLRDTGRVIPECVVRNSHTRLKLPSCDEGFHRIVHLPS